MNNAHCTIKSKMKYLGSHRLILIGHNICDKNNVHRHDRANNCGSELIVKIMVTAMPGVI